MRIIAKTLLFILSKWDLSMDEFYPMGKVLFYIPNLLNNILNQVYYFCLFPIICLYLYMRESLESSIALFMLLSNYTKDENR